MKKRKVGSKHELYTHNIAVSSTVSMSADNRRIAVETQQFAEAPNATSIQVDQEPGQSEDLATLRMVDDISNFSFLLGEELPIGEDPLVEGDAITVTLGKRRNANSVSTDFAPMSMHELTSSI